MFATKSCVSCRCFQPHALTFSLLSLSFKEQFLVWGKKSKQTRFLLPSPPFTASDVQAARSTLQPMDRHLLLGSNSVWDEVGIVPKSQQMGYTRCQNLCAPGGVVLIFILSRQARLAKQTRPLNPRCARSHRAQRPPSALSPPSSPSLQARVPCVDGDAAAGDVPAVLCPCHRAHLRRRPQLLLRLGQEAVRRRAQQLLLGLLLDTDYWRTHQ